MGHLSRRPALASLGLLGLLAAPAHAQSRPPLEGPYRLDLYQGAVLGSARVIGLGGAYVSVAEGTEGVAFNPAAAVQRPYHVTAETDWAWHVDFLLSKDLSGRDLDLDNNGRAATSDALLLTGGLGIYAGDHGGALSASVQNLDLGERRGVGYSAVLVDGRIVAGSGLFDHQLLLAGGLRAGALSLRREDAAESLFDVAVVGLEAGALWRPRAWPIRLGAMFSLPFLPGGSAECDAACPPGFVPPEAVTLPWELRVGASYALGARPYNPRPERTPPPEDVDLDRDYRGGRYLLLSAEATIVGATGGDAIGPDGLVEQVREPVGDAVTVAARFGAEAEILRRRLRLRLGTYWEPSRYEGRDGRLHGTSSLLVRLFDFTLWGRHALAWSPAVDVADGYLNLSFLLSFWH